MGYETLKICEIWGSDSDVAEDSTVLGGGAVSWVHGYWRFEGSGIFIFKDQEIKVVVVVVVVVEVEVEVVVVVVVVAIVIVVVVVE